MLKNDAEKLLNSFNDEALNKKMIPYFEEASNVVYAPTCNQKVFEVKLDTCYRLYFRCIICNKDMNNVRSLKEHTLSGSHLKNYTDNFGDIEIKKSCQKQKNLYDRSSLRYKLSVCKLKVIGIHLLEEYYGPNRKLFYVCILCNSFGTIDDILAHMIGDAHTDRYIRKRLILKSQSITSEERSYLRDAIYDKENYTVDDIVAFQSKLFYPSVLEDETKPMLKKFIEKQFNYPPCLPVHNSVIDVEETSNKCCQTDLSSESMQEFNEKISSIQDIYLHPEETRLKSAVDLWVCIRILFASLHFVYFGAKLKYKKSRRDSVEESEACHIIDTCKKMMWSVSHTLANKYKDVYNIDLELNAREQ